MSRPARCAGFAIATVLATTALAGQTPEEQAHIERLIRRYDSLSTWLTGAAESGSPAVDSIRVGPLWIVSDSVEAPSLREAARRLEGMLAGELGAFPQVARGARIAVRFGPPSPGWGRVIGGDGQFVGRAVAVSTRQLTRQLTHAVEGILALRAGAAVTAWGGDLRLFSDAAPLLEATNVELRTTTVPGTEECLDAIVEGCARALGLVASSGGPEAAAGVRRFIQSRLTHRGSELELAPSYAACVRGDDDACFQFLERAGVPEPGLSRRAQSTLLLAMREVGGPDAYARFFADTAAAMIPRLEAGAGVPLDSLLARWRGEVLTHQPAPTTVPGVTQWLVLFWAVTLVAAATRSTRWR